MSCLHQQRGHPECVNRPSRLSFVACWIILCAFLHCAGWGLSAIHQLNRSGYAALFALGVAVFAFWQSKQGAGLLPRIRLRKLRRRFRRSFPLAFLIIATLAILGSMLYGPSNLDALSARIARVCHWLSEQRWHWIHTGFNALNTRVCAIEWVSAPLLAFMQSYRLFFLPNVISFLLLPSLIFSVFTRLGVRPRVAWHWMWLLPTGYCYLLQAGSVANDLFGAPFALAAVDFGLRAKESRRFRDVALGVFSAALVTSTKSSNLPLLLPCAIALLPSWKQVLCRPIALGALLLMTALCSFLPTAALNVKYCGDWTGLTAENLAGAFGGYPFLRLAYNSVTIVVYNLTPPVFPVANAFSAAMNKQIPASLRAALDNCFKSTYLPGDVRFRLPDLQVEEDAGLGFGITLLAFIALSAKIFGRTSRREGARWSGERTFRMAMTVSPFAALAAFMAKGGWAQPVRYLAPYYPLLLPLLLVGREQAELVRKRWWKLGGGVVFLLAGLLVVVSPARPLWPAEWVLTKVGARSSTSPLLARAVRVYSIYGRRSDAFAQVRSLLPAEAKVLGMITGGDPEASLWMPWGARRIEHVCPLDTAEDLRRKGIKYVLVKSSFFKLEGSNWPFKVSLAEWLTEHDGEIVQTIPLDLRVSENTVDWYLVKLR
jgi:hypothetical protein